MTNLLQQNSPYSQASLDARVTEVGKWLAWHKAKDISRIDLARSAFADTLFVVSALSIRQAQALADGLGEFCRAQNQEFLGMEGYSSGQWILVDLNDIIVNIFQEETRDLYRLEDLWQQTDRTPLEGK